MNYELLARETQQHYRNMAEGFYQKIGLSEDDILVDVIEEKLESVASNYRPDSWRNLRNAISFDLNEKGMFEEASSIRLLANPVTTKPGMAVKAKSARVKKISADELMQIYEAAAKEKDLDVISAVHLAMTFGCRPVEMPTIDYLGEGIFKITGAKKRHDRGLDRFIKLTGEKEIKSVRNAIQKVQQSDIKRIQNRLSTIVRNVFPKRQHHPSLYTFRHMMGTALKISQHNRKTIAYLMGHKVTASVDVYGNRRSTSWKTPMIEPAISQEEINTLIKANHQEAEDVLRSDNFSKVAFSFRH